MMLMMMKGNIIDQIENMWKTDSIVIFISLLTKTPKSYSVRHHKKKYITSRANKLLFSLYFQTVLACFLNSVAVIEYSRSPSVLTQC